STGRSTAAADRGAGPARALGARGSGRALAVGWPRGQASTLPAGARRERAARGGGQAGRGARGGGHPAPPAPPPPPPPPPPHLPLSSVPAGDGPRRRPGTWRCQKGTGVGGRRPEPPGAGASAAGGGAGLAAGWTPATPSPELDGEVTARPDPIAGGSRRLQDR